MYYKKVNILILYKHYSINSNYYYKVLNMTKIKLNLIFTGPCFLSLQDHLSTNNLPFPIQFLVYIWFHITISTSTKKKVMIRSKCNNTQHIFINPCPKYKIVIFYLF